MPHSRKASNSSLRVLRQIGSGGGFDLGEEVRGVLLDQAVQRGLLGAVTLVVDRDAIRPCPVQAIFPDNAVPAKWQDYTAKNRTHFENK